MSDIKNDSPDSASIEPSSNTATKSDSTAASRNAKGGGTDEHTDAAPESNAAGQHSQLLSYMRTPESGANAGREAPARTLGEALARSSSNSIPPFADIAITPEGVAAVLAPSEAAKTDDSQADNTEQDVSEEEYSPKNEEVPQADGQSSGAHAQKNEFWTTRLRPDEDENASTTSDGDGDAYAPDQDALSGEEHYSPGAPASDSPDTSTDKPLVDGAATAGKGKGFFSTHPKLAAEQSMPPSIASRLFTLLALMPILSLSALLIAQVLFSLDARDLWYSDEIRHADAFRNMLNDGSWFVLHMNGDVYPDKPPLYFWFLRGLYELLQQEGPLLYFGAAAISGLLYLWASIFLGRFVARVDARTMLASGILLLCGGFVMGLLHYARMDLLFSALVLCSYAAFYHAWIRPQSISCMLLAFIFGALAVLTKGPLGLVLPLGASVLFLLWRGTPMRLFRWDTLLGLLVGAVIIGSWVGAASLELGGHEQFIDLYITRQTIGRVFDAFHHQQPWYYYLAGLPLMVLPWTLLVLALPWLAPFSKKWWQGLASSRKPEGEGLAYMWCIVLSALILLSAISGKLLIYFLPALPALCIIMGRAVLQLSPRRAGFFRHTLAFLLLVLGLAFIAATLMLFGYLPAPEIKGVPDWRLLPNIGFFAVGGGIVITAFFLWLLLHSSRPEGVLLVVAVCFTLLSFPLAVMVAPSFDVVLSPKAQALAMKDLAGKGYTPISFKDYGGTYSYYAGRAIMETRDRQTVQNMAAKQNIALAVRLKDWEEWENKPAGCTEVHRQWIETKVHLLLACTPEAAGQPGDVEQPANSGHDAGAPASDTASSLSDDSGAPDTAPPDTPESSTQAEPEESRTAVPTATNSSMPTVAPVETDTATPRQTTPAQPSGRTLGDWLPGGESATAPDAEPAQNE